MMRPHMGIVRDSSWNVRDSLWILTESERLLFLLDTDIAVVVSEPELLLTWETPKPTACASNQLLRRRVQLGGEGPSVRTVETAVPCLRPHWPSELVIVGLVA